jgi:hypothetical protein
MSERVLAFVNSADDARPAEPGSLTVVLSPWWTPGPPDGPAITSVRPLAQRVLGRVDLPAHATEALDRWALEAGMPGLFLFDGVDWWDRVRMALRWDMYELVLWRYVLADLDAGDRFDRVEVPADKPHIASVCAALGLAWKVRAPELDEEDEGPREPSPGIAGQPKGGDHRAPASGGGDATRAAGPGIIRRVLRRVGRQVLYVLGRGPQPLIRAGRRLGALDHRLDDLARRPGVLVVAWAGAYQVHDDGHATRRGDPFLDPAIDELRRRGEQVTIAVQGLSIRKADDWRPVQEDPNLIPQAYVTARWVAEDDATVDLSARAAVVAAGGRIALDVSGCDLAPAVAALAASYSGEWLEVRRRLTRSAGGFLDRLRPRAMLLDREGTRLPWIAAARARGIPVVTTQHGMIYPGNPEYVRTDPTRSMRPDRTCVFGPYERDLLVDTAGYDPTEVVVVGSPRIADPAAPPLPRSDGPSVRRELGVADGDRIVVISAAHGPIGELLTACMLSAVLHGPLPGIHLVVKVHPQDQAPADYLGFFADLARAGDYAAPAVSVVRDIDLGRLFAVADAHLGSNSTMLTDAVAAGLLNMVALGQAHADPLGYVSAGVGVAVRCVDDVRMAMADPRPPSADARIAFLGRHFLAGDASARLVDVVLETGRATAAQMS